MNGNMDMFILILYVAIILFFAYRIFKTKKNKSLLNGNFDEFGREISKLEIALLIVLLVTGIINFYQGFKLNDKTSMATAGVMIVLALIFGLYSKNKMYIGENGILANSNFYNYKELKKWGFDKESSDLVLQVKKDNQSSNEIVKVKKEDIEAINNLIRKYKLNK